MLTSPLRPPLTRRRPLPEKIFRIPQAVKWPAKRHSHGQRKIEARVERRSRHTKRDSSGRTAALRACDVIPRNANFVAQLDSFQYRFSREIKKVTASQNDRVKQTTADRIRVMRLSPGQKAIRREIPPRCFAALGETPLAPTAKDRSACGTKKSAHEEGFFGPNCGPQNDGVKQQHQTEFESYNYLPY
jgi:hypothetical protein